MAGLWNWHQNGQHRRQLLDGRSRRLRRRPALVKLPTVDHWLGRLILVSTCWRHPGTSTPQIRSGALAVNRLMTRGGSASAHSGPGVGLWKSALHLVFVNPLSSGTSCGNIAGEPLAYTCRSTGEQVEILAPHHSRQNHNAPPSTRPLTIPRTRDGSTTFLHLNAAIRLKSPDADAPMKMLGW